MIDKSEIAHGLNVTAAQSITYVSGRIRVYQGCTGYIISREVINGSVTVRFQGANYPVRCTLEMLDKKVW